MIWSLQTHYVRDMIRHLGKQYVFVNEESILCKLRIKTLETALSCQLHNSLAYTDLKHIIVSRIPSMYFVKFIKSLSDSQSPCSSHGVFRENYACVYLVENAMDC